MEAATSAAMPSAEAAATSGRPWYRRVWWRPLLESAVDVTNAMSAPGVMVSSAATPEKTKMLVVSIVGSCHMPLLERHSTKHILVQNVIDIVPFGDGDDEHQRGAREIA